jgi:hypothetical protein
MCTGANFRNSSVVLTAVQIADEAALGYGLKRPELLNLLLDCVA